MYTKNDYLKKLQQDVELRDYSDRTLERYISNVSNFLNYMETIDEDKAIADYDEYDALEYMAYLQREREYKNSTYNTLNSVLKFFLEVTLGKNISYRRMPSKKVGYRIKVIPTKKVIEYIIANTKNLKHKCWYSLAYGSGLRVCEIAKLKMKDIDSRNMKIRVIGKGNHERITLLSRPTLDLLIEYVNSENIRGAETYIFAGQNREHISEATIALSLRKLLRKLKIKEKITMHAFRRSFATHLLMSGVELEAVKELMGHKSILTTSEYLKYVHKDTQIKSPLDRKNS